MTKTIIRWCFYLLFFATPLLFAPWTSELFEWNKMMFVYLMTIIIASLWIYEMLSERQFLFKRTPLDIPIVLFLISQILSTFFSIDPHTSLFGYYSRLNGGLLSTICYILLFYALISHFEKNNIRTLLKSAIFGGVVVALWAIPEHFGHSLSCLILTNNFNATCWVQDVQARVFATLGQPNWLAAYMEMLIFPTLYMMVTAKEIRGNLFYAFLSLAFYLAFTFTFSRGATFGFIGGLIVFLVFIVLPKETFSLPQSLVKKLGLINLVVSAGVSFIGPLQEKLAFTSGSLHSLYLSSHLLLQIFITLSVFIVFSLGELILLQKKSILALFSKGTSLRFLGLVVILFLVTNLVYGSALTRFQLFSPSSSSVAQPTAGTQLETGGTESGQIRLIVWKGALSIFKAYPILGSGVETFAYSYYQFRPVEHNLTSEWDFLYNKAHNEFLNYLATTGAVGFLSYMVMIGVFLFWSVKKIISLKMKKGDQHWSEILLLSAIVGSYISYLIQNFFGFSVVIVALFFFLFPALSFIESGTPTFWQLPHFFTQLSKWIYRRPINVQIAMIVLVIITGLFVFSLSKIYASDMVYKQGSDDSDAGDTGKAYLEITKAVAINNGEPLYHSDLGYNAAATALALSQEDLSASADAKLKQEDKATIRELTTQAVSETDKSLSISPKNTSLWRTAIRTYVQLALLDSGYEKNTLDAVNKAIMLAPTDPKLVYNQALIIEQFDQLNASGSATPAQHVNNAQKVIPILQKAVALKPDYHEALFKLATEYEAVGDKTRALQEYQTILHYIPNDSDSLKKVAELSTK